MESTQNDSITSTNLEAFTDLLKIEAPSSSSSDMEKTVLGNIDTEANQNPEQTLSGETDTNCIKVNEIECAEVNEKNESAKHGNLDTSNQVPSIDAVKELGEGSHSKENENHLKHTEDIPFEVHKQSVEYDEQEITSTDCKLNLSTESDIEMKESTNILSNNDAQNVIVTDLQVEEQEITSTECNSVSLSTEICSTQKDNTDQLPHTHIQTEDKNFTSSSNESDVNSDINSNGGCQINIDQCTKTVRSATDEVKECDQIEVDVKELSVGTDKLIGNFISKNEDSNNDKISQTRSNSEVDYPKTLSSEENMEIVSIHDNDAPVCNEGPNNKIDDNVLENLDVDKEENMDHSKDISECENLSSIEAVREEVVSQIESPNNEIDDIVMKNLDVNVEEKMDHSKDISECENLSSIEAVCEEVVSQIESPNNEIDDIVMKNLDVNEEEKMDHSKDISECENLSSIEAVCEEVVSQIESPNNEIDDIVMKNLDVNEEEKMDHSKDISECENLSSIEAVCEEVVSQIESPNNEIDDNVMKNLDVDKEENMDHSKGISECENLSSIEAVCEEVVSQIESPNNEIDDIVMKNLDVNEEEKMDHSKDISECENQSSSEAVCEEVVSQIESPNNEIDDIVMKNLDVDKEENMDHSKGISECEKLSSSEAVCEGVVSQIEEHNLETPKSTSDNFHNLQQTQNEETHSKEKCIDTVSFASESKECDEVQSGNLVTLENDSVETANERMIVDDGNIESNEIGLKSEFKDAKGISESSSIKNQSDALQIDENSPVTSEKAQEELNSSGDEFGDFVIEGNRNSGVDSTKKMETDEVTEEKSMDCKSVDSSDTESKSNLELAIKSALEKNEKFRKTLSPQFNTSSNNDNDSVDNINSTSKETEVISLVDDDDDDDNYAHLKRKSAAALNCINPNCKSGEDLVKPAMFVLTYFGVKRGKNQKVCAECLQMAEDHQEKLAAMLANELPLHEADFPSHKDVILLDSDEESFSEDENYLSDDTMEVIRNNLYDDIVETLAKYKLDHQIRESCHCLNNKLDHIEDEVKFINDSFNQVQKTLDESRKLIYQDFTHEIHEVGEIQLSDCEIPPMPILMSKRENKLYQKELQNQLRKRQQQRESAYSSPSPNSSEVRTVATKKVSPGPHYQFESLSQDVITIDSELHMDPPDDLPPTGPLIRPKLKVGDMVYAMKVSHFGIWVPAKVIEIIPRIVTENDSSTETYRVRLDYAKKNLLRAVTGKYLAYSKPPDIQPPVGTRVIAIFKEEEDSPDSKENYYVGVIAESPKVTNKYRYLVFFDDGYAQYCPHRNILVVCYSSKNVWEDIHPEPQDFIKKYLNQYPERPMVKLSPGQIVRVEWKGKWWMVQVLEVDASLVKVHFAADNRTEWIYRGSTRLGPMYQEVSAVKERQSGSLLRSRGFGNTNKKNLPYVEYTWCDNEEKEEEDKEKQEEAPVVPTRSVARKSTSKKPAEPVISNPQYSRPLVPYIPQGKVITRTLKEDEVVRARRFQPHQCDRSCVTWTGYTDEKGKKYDPLIRPLYFGFERLLVTVRGKTLIMYRAPCGRTIRSHQEMLCYLQGTKMTLTIDLFDFDYWVNPFNEFKESRTFCHIEDLSYQRENVPISCVNELDHCMPQYVQYITARQPGENVPLNLDPDFLVCCDCTDDCENRSKCSCWKLTMQGKRYNPDGNLDPLFGYQYRRLPERIATGIYECNSRCKCNQTCQNRVAQQPLSFRLQLFKTPKKGWGIRCLHDIPKGAFICIYVGYLLTDQAANEGGKTYGDEYLAELDYIESVENLKEGYEPTVVMKNNSDNEELSKKYFSDNSEDETMVVDSEEEEVGSGESSQEASNERRRHREDIRLRLRRRLPEEGERDKRPKSEDDAISISDDETEPDAFYYTVSPFSDEVRRPQAFDNNITEDEDREPSFPSVRDLFGPSESVFIMDAKTHGNIGRYLNHSCSPNVFVQNVFVDTHDPRFPWVAFFANQHISAGTELTWDYNYDVGSVPGKVMLCYCNSPNCRGRLL